MTVVVASRVSYRMPRTVLAAVMPAPRVPVEIRELPEPDLPPGGALLRALTTLLTASAMRSPAGLDARVLNGFASETARQQAVMQVVQSLAYADAARARSIADANLTDAAMRAQVERVLEAARNNPQRGQIRFGVPAPTQGIRASQ